MAHRLRAVVFNGLKEGKELYRMTLPKTGWSPNTGVHRIAVDASAKLVRIWMPYIYHHPAGLYCIEEIVAVTPDGHELLSGAPRELATL